MIDTKTPLVQTIDHIVLTVQSIEASIQFYSRTLGLQSREFKPGRWSLHFGDQKINLHEVGTVVDEYVRHATPGSADICFRTNVPLDEMIRHLNSQQVDIILGPIKATGARAMLSSIYFYDLDENLIEISNEV